jgi:hypothetical protein
VTAVAPAPATLLDPRTPHPRTTTPVRLRALAAAVVLLALPLATVVTLAVTSVGDGYREIGGKAAPQVVATSDLTFELNDMDADLANVLLIGDDHRLDVSSAQAVTAFDRARVAADSDLQQAGAAAGNDRTAQRALRTVLDALGGYEELASQTILLDQQAHHLAGHAPQEVVSRYRQATAQLRNTVLPAVQTLTRANSARLTSTYDSQRRTISGTVALTWVVGLLLVGVLVGLQLYLRYRFHRRLNPFVLAATLATLVLLVVTSSTLSAAGDHLKVAKRDSFDSVLALGLARATGYSANADESRFLADPQGGAAYARDFLARSQSLLTVPGATLDTYASKLDSIVGTLPSGRRHRGYLGDELANITFPGEQQAAVSTTRAYVAYEENDRTLRYLVAQGRLRDAINFDTSTAAGRSDASFNVYDQDLVATIEINQAHFDRAVRQGESTLRPWAYLPGAALAAIVALALAGIAPRLREYR